VRFPASAGSFGGPTSRRRFRTGRDVARRGWRRSTDPQVDPDRRAWPPGAKPRRDRTRTWAGGAGALGRPGAGSRGAWPRAAAFPRAGGDADARTRSPGRSACSRRPARKRDAGRAGRVTGGCWSRVEAGQLDRLQTAELERPARDQIAYDQRRVSDGRPAAPERGPAPRATRRGPGRARRTLEALGAAMWGRRPGLPRRPAGRAAEAAAGRAPPGPDPARARLTSSSTRFAIRFHEGIRGRPRPTLTRALEQVLAPGRRHHRGRRLALARRSGSRGHGRPRGLERHILARPGSSPA